MTDDQSLECAINASVALTPYDHRWPGLFELERDRINGLFPGSFVSIEHIGSTSVPGIPAKPIVDMMAGVLRDYIPQALFDDPRRYGYIDSIAIGSKVTDHRWFMRWENGRRTHHLHLIKYNSSQWRERLKLRDTLRGDHKVAEQYAALKLQLASKLAMDREAYTAGKTSFILSVSRDA